jgi:hypothetical protein
MTAKGPRAGRLPQKRRLYEPLTPRPCGEMTNGIGGCRFGPYQAGSTRKAFRGRPAFESYESLSTRTPPSARLEVAAAGAGAEATATETRRTRPASLPGSAHLTICPEARASQLAEMADVRSKRGAK